MTAVRELFSRILSELGRMVCGDEVQEHYFMWKLAIRFTQTISRAGRQRSARRYSNLSFAGVDVF